MKKKLRIETQEVEGSCPYNNQSLVNKWVVTRMELSGAMGEIDKGDNEVQISS